MFGVRDIILDYAFGELSITTIATGNPGIIVTATPAYPSQYVRQRKATNP